MQMISDILFLPHGMQIIPNVESNQKLGFKELDLSMHQMLKRVANSGNKSNRIILITPHGYNLENELVLYHHTDFTGDIYELEESNVLGKTIKKLEFKGDLEITENIFELLNQQNLPVQKLIHGYPEYPLHLNWGEVVPMYYLSQYLEASYSILCYPRTRHNDLNHINYINQKLIRALQDIDEDIILVISGDLSHVHIADGPYGDHPVAEEFDKSILRWAGEMREELMENITEMQPDGLACGYAGINLIHHLAMVQTLDLQESFYRVPTYFGMAGFWWKNISKDSQN